MDDEAFRGSNEGIEINPGFNIKNCMKNVAIWQVQIHWCAETVRIDIRKTSRVEKKHKVTEISPHRMLFNIESNQACYHVLKDLQMRRGKVLSMPKINWNDLMLFI